MSDFSFGLAAYPYAPSHHVACDGRCSAIQFGACELFSSCWRETYHLGRGLRLLGHVLTRCLDCRRLIRDYGFDVYHCRCNTTDRGSFRRPKQNA